VEKEHGEKHTRLGPTQGNLAVPVPHLERPKIRNSRKQDTVTVRLDEHLSD